MYGNTLIHPFNTFTLSPTTDLERIPLMETLEEFCTLCADKVDYCECRRCEDCEELSLINNDICTECGGEFY